MREARLAIGWTFGVVGTLLVLFEVGMALSEDGALGPGRWQCVLAFFSIGLAMMFGGVRLACGRREKPTLLFPGTHKRNTETQAVASPIQYGLCDLVGVAVLAGVNMLVLSRCVNVADDSSKWVAFGVVSIIPALVAGYIAFRIATVKGITTPRRRLLLLCLAEAGLLCVYPGIPLLLEAIFSWLRVS